MDRLLICFSSVALVMARPDHGPGAPLLRHKLEFPSRSAPQGTVFDPYVLTPPPHSHREDPKAGNARIFIPAPKDPSVMTTICRVMLL